MSDFSSAVSEDNRFSTSDVGLKTNLKEDSISKDGLMNLIARLTSFLRPDIPLCPLLVASLQWTSAPASGYPFAWLLWRS